MTDTYRVVPSVNWSQLSGLQGGCLFGRMWGCMLLSAGSQAGVDACAACGQVVGTANEEGCGMASWWAEAPDAAQEEMLED